MRMPTDDEFRTLTEGGLNSGEIVELIAYRDKLIEAGRIDNRLATRDLLRIRQILPPRRADP